MAGLPDGRNNEMINLIPQGRERLLYCHPALSTLIMQNLYISRLLIDYSDFIASILFKDSKMFVVSFCSVSKHHTSFCSNDNNQ
jgi:hypothetical protein